MRIGLIAALGPELGGFEPGAGADPGAELEVAGARLLAVVSGVGKVAAAGAAATLATRGVDALLVVGTCGGLVRGDRPGARVGDLVHVERAIQWDLAVREGREVTSDERLLAAWRSVAPGPVGTALTADRPAVRWVERARRARARARTSPTDLVVADMETAAIGAVADRHGLPWAALRVVSDRRTPPWSRWLGRSDGGFAGNFMKVAARPAATVEALLDHLRASA